MPLHERDDGLVAAAVVRHAAVRLVLPGQAQQRLALSAAEMATNVVRHAGRGHLELRADASVVELWTFDEGPGFGAPVRPTRPGASATGSNGWGLAVIARAMHRFETGHAANGVTWACATLWRTLPRHDAGNEEGRVA